MLNVLRAAAVALLVLPGSFAGAATVGDVFQFDLGVTADFGGGSTNTAAETDFLGLLTQVSLTEVEVSFSFAGSDFGFGGVGLQLDPDVVFGGFTSGAGIADGQIRMNQISVLGDTDIDVAISLFSTQPGFAFSNGNSFAVSFSNPSGLDAMTLDGLFVAGNNTGSFGLVSTLGVAPGDGTFQGFSGASLYDPNPSTVALSGTGLYSWTWVLGALSLALSVVGFARVGLFVVGSAFVEAATGAAFLPDPGQALLLLGLMGAFRLVRLWSRSSLQLQPVRLLAKA